VPDSVCYQCFTDTYLSDQVANEGEIEECRVCRETRETITVERLGQILEPIMRQNLAIGREIPDIGENDRLYYRQLGDSMAYWVQEILGQYFDFEDEIVSAVIDADDYWPPDGEEAYWDNTQDYEPIEHTSDDFYRDWRATLQDVKHGRRFFSEKARRFFDELFADVEHMHLPKKPRSGVVRVLPAGKNLFRARTVTDTQLLRKMLEDPLTHIGPPPPHAARAGRMNAEGISVFYGALDAKTCIAEMRPAIGGHTAIVKLKTDRRLRVLDFARLDKARPRKSLSYFQPDYQRQKQRRAFLRMLHTLISQPVTPGREADYIITQTMAEYLAHVAAQSYDGIMFKSAQREGGTNVVLFPARIAEDDEEAKPLPVSVAGEPVRLYRTKSVMYSHIEQLAYSANDSEDYVVLREGNEHDEYNDF
jgi:hypothetical protein